jgi:flagellar biosynthesis protein FlhG
MTEADVKPVLVIGSGKGGVGKSIISILIAHALSERGLRVLLVDGSQNLGHLHVLLGVSVTARLEQVFRGDAEAVALIQPVTERLSLLASDSGAEALYGLAGVDQARLHHRLAEAYHAFDLVVIDAGSGVETAVRLAAMGGTRLIVVTVPEVAALTDAYALIKLVHAQLPSLPMDIVVNRIAEPGEGDQAFDRLAFASERFLGRALGKFGGLPEAAAMRETMRRPGAVLTDERLNGLRRAVRDMVVTHLPAEAFLVPAALPSERTG